MIIGYQAVYDTGYLDAIDFAHANGFDFVSFDLNVPRFYLEQFSEQELSRIRSHAEAGQIGLAFHAPGDNVSLFADYPAVRRGILEHFTGIIERARLLNARHVTIHAGAHPSFKKSGAATDDFGAEHEDYYSNVLHENLATLCGHCRTVRLCVENYEFDALTMRTVEQVLDDLPLYLAWDIPKTYDRELRCDADVQRFMLDHLDRLIEVHLHDLKRGLGQHQTVGQGDIDFRKYESVLLRPDIAVTIEVRPREEALISRQSILRLLGLG